MGVIIWLVTSFLIVVASPAAGSVVCDRCVHQSRATFYQNSAKAFSLGSCGYATKDTKFNVNDLFAGATVSIYNNGIACGRCYQIRCKDKKYCNNKGTTVTVINLNEKTYTAFVLSKSAFIAMANHSVNGSVGNLMKPDSVGIEYKSVPCNYGNKNMMIWVEDFSKKDKKYLAIKFLYKEGQTDIVAVNVFNNEKSQVPMKISYGAIWYTSNVPSGALRFQFKVTSKTGYNFYTTKPKPNYGLPANWIKGKEYNSGLQFNDVAQDKKCHECDHKIWK